MAVRAAFEKCEQFKMHLRRLGYLLCLAPASTFGKDLLGGDSVFLPDADPTAIQSQRDGML